jgi:beta-glucosidase
LQGIESHVGESTTVTYEKGCNIGGDDRSHIPEAVNAAKDADVAVVVVGDQSGIGQYGTVGEGIDSTKCELPGVQRELVEAIAATGTPTIVVLSHGRAFRLDWMDQCVPAILTSFFGGEEAGNAMADVLFGDVNPAGRLPVSFLKDTGAAPLPYWRTGRFNPYVDGSVDAVFPFGHGKSYTDFVYDDVSVRNHNVDVTGDIELSFTVANTGSRDGDEVIQIYGKDVVASAVRPERKLVAFERAHIPAGKSVKIAVTIPSEMFALWQADGSWVIEPGKINLFIGASSTDIRLQTSVDFIGDIHKCGARRKLFSNITVQDCD